MAWVRRIGNMAISAFSSERRRNWGLPLLSAVCGCVMFTEGLQLPLIAQYSGLGAGFMVAFVGAALLVIAVVLAAQILRGQDFEPEEAEGVDLDQPVSSSGLALAAAGVVLPIVCIPWLGFVLGAAFAYACVARAFGSLKSVRDAMVGLLLSAMIGYLFTKLGVQLGPLLPLIGR